MRKSILGTLATSVLGAIGSIGTRSREVGDQAPGFEAPSTRGTIHLADYLGKKSVVLAFYYADFTPG